MLEISDFTPIHVTEPAKSPTSIAVDVVAQAATPMTRGTDVMCLLPPSGVLELPANLLDPEVILSKIW